MSLSLILFHNPGALSQASINNYEQRGIANSTGAVVVILPESRSCIFGRLQARRKSANVHEPFSDHLKQAGS